MIDRSDRHWYKDAIIYQTHVKAFFDANGDGSGDFAGLTAKLDYIQALGATAIWLLPFYPSPLKDDGYDIADYRGINPRFGTLRDFKAFVRECHDRGLRLITELVVNHTSSDHPWFQRARRARPGSPHRNFYVWSDNDQRYAGTRIIFCDTEKSNWTWDEEAQAYYWHRFYSHQPDLNFDNPKVLEAVLATMRFWLDLGVDGLRLDAVPYLIEREGTNNENLPETHDVLKRIRAELDRHYTDRLLLAEANQWPEDVLPYFGDPAKGGDECHMAFHFPLMPRMYMALAQEDRHPVTDIMRQTPEIPASAQWAIFLRNHDELTLEMVTSRERDYLWNFYATDRRARINLGIRRRLAPLLDNDRRKIELMTGLLLSMPGTPVLYYGDEIGMGDNLYLGDRDGVRTPMQWSPDRNGGFSRADPQSLFLPSIQDPIFGFQAVNVEAQQKSPSSLLNWTRRVVQVRQQQKAFGRGALRFLYPGNRKVLAYLRSHEDELLLCVANLSRSAQAVELDLREARSRVPVELIGRSKFPPIGDLPYLLTLPAYGFYWFTLATHAALPAWHEPIPEPMPDLMTLVMAGASPDGWHLETGDRNARLLEEVLPTFLAKQRWYAGKDPGALTVQLVASATLPGPAESFQLVRLDVARAGDAGPSPYFLPLALSFDEQAGQPGWACLPYTVARVRRGARVGATFDATQASGFAATLVRAMRSGEELAVAAGGIIAGNATAELVALGPVEDDAEVRPQGAEQSNSSILIGDQMVLKIYRRLAPGLHPELEMARFLTERVRFANTPPLLGWLEHRQDGHATALAVLQGFVRNQGDGWTFTLDYLERELEEIRLALPAVEADPFSLYRPLARKLGERTAQLHRALGTPTGDAAFDPEPVRRTDVERWAEAARHQAGLAFAALRHALQAGADNAARAEIERMMAREADVLARIALLARPPAGAVKIRTHGDFHLGQVLRAGEDWYLIDFEGEPAKTVAERRAKTSPWRDVAGMLRSFSYAAWAALRRVGELHADAAGRLAPPALQWEQVAREAFLAGYHAAGGEDAAAGRGLLGLFMLEKALYEVTYEAGHRPGWLAIPVRGLVAALDQAPEIVPALAAGED